MTKEGLVILENALNPLFKVPIKEGYNRVVDVFGEEIADVALVVFIKARIVNPALPVERSICDDESIMSLITREGIVTIGS